MTTLAVMLAGPPILLWVWWLRSASTSPRPGAPDSTEQLSSGDELPFRRADRSRDAIH
jgi:hypothetical protein